MMSDEQTTEFLNDRHAGKHPALGAPYGNPHTEGRHLTDESYILDDSMRGESRPTNFVPVKCKLLNENAVKPTQGTADSAGYDLFATEECTIGPNETKLLPLGFCTEIHPDYHCRIESRSGMATKGLVVLTGVVDADYRGEWHVILRNFNAEPVEIAKGQRVAQGVFRPTVRATFQPVSELSESARGSGGFGSTGR